MLTEGKMLHSKKPVTKTSKQTGMINKIKQFFCSHDWTCKASQGILPPKDGIKDIKSFYEYATMYCSNCGKVSDISKRHYEDL